MSDSINDLAETLYNARREHEQYGWREWSDLDERARKKWESAVEAVAPLIRAQALEEAARYCEETAMGIDPRGSKVFDIYIPLERSGEGSHQGMGYAAAIRALGGKDE